MIVICFYLETTLCYPLIALSSLKPDRCGHPSLSDDPDCASFMNGALLNSCAAGKCEIAPGCQRYRHVKQDDTFILAFLPFTQSTKKLSCQSYACLVQFSGTVITQKSWVNLKERLVNKPDILSINNAQGVRQSIHSRHDAKRYLGLTLRYSVKTVEGYKLRFGLI